MIKALGVSSDSCVTMAYVDYNVTARITFPIVRSVRAARDCYVAAKQACDKMAHT